MQKYNQRLPKKLLSGQVNGCSPRVALGLASMNQMLHQVTVMNAASLGRKKIVRKNCFGETRLVLHVTSSA